MQFNLYQKLFFHSNLSEWPLGQGEPSMLGYGKIFTPNKACDLKWNEVPRTSMKDDGEAYLFILSEKFCLIKKRKRTHSNVFSVSEGHAAWVLPRLNGRARARVCVCTRVCQMQVSPLKSLTMVLCRREPAPLTSCHARVISSTCALLSRE